MALDLFGQEIIEDVLLRDKYIEPPFSVLDSKNGNWQIRKSQWKKRGIKSEVGRKENTLKYSNTLNTGNYTGTSIFDPVLCELMYRWFCPESGLILDTFAGGSVRGIVANYLSYKYTGLELRQEQVDSNREQALDILPLENQPQWYCGDSDKLLDGQWEHKFDFIFSCPPYMDLEKYSDLPDDLSTLSDADFDLKYSNIINKACKILKPGCYAVFVVGDVRDNDGYYKDLITMTKMAFYKAGLKLYNEAILLENGLNTAAMRADKQFTAGKKLVKVHQNVLVFKKP
jgi:hypothetical protein